MTVAIFLIISLIAWYCYCFKNIWMVRGGIQDSRNHLPLGIVIGLFLICLIPILNIVFIGILHGRWVIQFFDEWNYTMPKYFYNFLKLLTKEV